MEEYIEATSFLYYLVTGRLISLEEVQANLSDRETGEPVRLSSPLLQPWGPSARTPSSSTSMSSLRQKTTSWECLT